MFEENRYMRVKQLNPLEFEIVDEDKDFGFTFEKKEDWTLKKVKFKNKKIDPELWEAIFQMRWELIKAHRKERDQYRKKIKACEDREWEKRLRLEQEKIWRENKQHLQEHIRKAETKLCEYKNTILAFWKLASCNSISK